MTLHDTSAGAKPAAGAPGGYTSALDLGTKAVPSGNLPAEGAAPPLPAAEGTGTGDLTTPAKDRDIEADIKVILIDAPGGLATIDQIHEGLKSMPGAHVPRGVVEVTLLGWEKSSIAARNGDNWTLTTTARAEIETPEVVIARRAELLSTTLVMTMPDSNDFNTLCGVSALQLGAFLRGPGDGGDVDGAFTATGFVAREIGADILSADLEALFAAGIFVKRTAAAEEHHGEEIPFGAEAKDDEEEIVDEVEEGDEEKTDEEPAADVDARPPVFAFAPGQVAKMLAIGAVALATLSVPASAPAVVEASTAAATDGLVFQRRLTAELEAMKERALRGEAFVQKIRTYLAPKRLEFLVDEVMGRPAPVPSTAVVYFGFTQTVRLDANEKAVILTEVDDLEHEIAEEHARIEGAKLAANSAKTTAKERIAELEEKKKGLLAMSHGSERTYTVEAYTELDTSGPEAVSIIRARSDNRELKRDVLKPAAMLAAMAKSEVQVAVPEVTASSSLLQKAASLAVEKLGEGAKAVVAAVDAATTATPDAAAAASAIADAAKTAAGEAAKARAKKVELSVPGLRPYMLAAVIGAGSIAEADVPKAVMAIIGFDSSDPSQPQSASLSAFIRVSLSKAVTAGEIVKDGEKLSFAMPKALLGLVAEEGDQGLRVSDVEDKLAATVGCFVTDEVRAAIAAGLTTAIDASDLARGPLPGGLGDLLWLGGQTDPRRSAAPAPTPPPAPAGKATGRGSKKAPAAAAAVGTPPPAATSGKKTRAKKK